MLSIGSLAHADTITWTNTAGGNWSGALNWSPNQVPGLNDTAVLPGLGNSYSVTLDVQASVSNLVVGATSGASTQAFFMGGQTLAVSAQIVVKSQGQFNFDSGTLTGTPVLAGMITWTGGSIGSFAAVTIATNAILNISGNNTLNLNGALINAGTVNWAGAASLEIDNYGLGGTTGGIVNQAGAVFNVQNDQPVINANGSVSAYFSNAGLLQKWPTTGTTTINVAFNNTGTVDVESGTMGFNGGGVGNGTFNAAANTAINFGGNNSGSAFTGTGLYTVSGGTVTINGAVQNVVLSDGALNGVSCSISNLTWNGGALQGTSTLTGMANWTGGSIGSFAAVTIATNAILNISGTNTLNLNGALITGWSFWTLKTAPA